MDWRLIGEGAWDDGGIYWDHGVFPNDYPNELMGRQELYCTTFGPSPDGKDTIFFTAGETNVLNSTASSFTLTYSLGFWYNCSAADIDDEDGFLRGAPYFSDGSVSFQVGDDGLDPVAALSDDRCPTGLRTLHMKGSFDAPLPHGANPPCVVLDDYDISPEPEPCRVKRQEICLPLCRV